MLLFREAIRKCFQPERFFCFDLYKQLNENDERFQLWRQNKIEHAEFSRN